MKIATVTNYVKTKPSCSMNQQSNMTFGMKGTIRPSRHNGFFWDESKLNILERNEEEMKELGRAFYEFTLKELKKVARISALFFFKNYKQSDIAYAKLVHACFAAKEEKADMENKLAELKRNPNPTQSDLAVITELKQQIDSFDINPNNYLDYVEAKDDPFAGVH